MQHRALQLLYITSEKNTEDKLTPDEFRRVEIVDDVLKDDEEELWFVEREEKKPWAFPEFFCATLEHKCLCTQKCTVKLDHRI